WGHKIERCLAGKGNRGAPVMAWKKKPGLAGGSRGVPDARDSDSHGQMIGKLLQVQTGAPVSSQAGRGCEDWHVVASKRNGPMGSVIKSTDLVTSSSTQIISKGCFDQLQSAEAFDLAELRVPPDLGADDSRGLECSRSQ
ncbi:hypothetical protein Dimus_037777, partial [Dionaea muscipula]